MNGTESIVLILMAVAAGYFIYTKTFKNKGCGCGKKECHNKKDN